MYMWANWHEFQHVCHEVKLGRIANYNHKRRSQAGELFTCLQRMVAAVSVRIARNR